MYHGAPWIIVGGRGYAANLFDCVSVSDIAVSVPLVSASFAGCGCTAARDYVTLGLRVLPHKRFPFVGSKIEVASLCVGDIGCGANEQAHMNVSALAASIGRGSQSSARPSPLMPALSLAEALRAAVPWM